jgi:hypothetical protein
VIRRWIAASLSLAIPVAALCAPLVHAHTDHHDADHHHGSPVVHAHVSPHAGHEGPRRNSSSDPAQTSPSSDAARTLPARDGNGERPVWLQVYVAVPPVSFDIPAAALTEVHLTTPRESVAHRPVDVVHAHDPPVRSLAAPRAPPSLLS